MIRRIYLDNRTEWLRMRLALWLTLPPGNIMPKKLLSH